MTFVVICHGMPCIEIIIQLAAIVWTGHQETWIACLNAIDLKSLDTSLHHDRIFSASARVPPSLGCLHFNASPQRPGGFMGTWKPRSIGFIHIDRIIQNLLTEFWPQRIWGDQINLAANPLLQIQLKADKLE